ncbi:collagen-like protein [Pyxidicoccus sp. 3LG]
MDVCTPGETFCEGEKLWACTRSGSDAVLRDTCSGGSANNPVGCFAGNCLSGNAACCRREKPACSWNFTHPATTGADYDSDNNLVKPGAMACVGPSACATDSQFQAYVGAYYASELACGATFSSINVTLTRPLPVPGQVFTLPHAQVTSLWLLTPQSERSCSRWTGTLTWHSEVPTWSVSVDATCSEAGKGHIRLVGTLSGDT